MTIPHFDSAGFERSINRRTFLGRSAYGLGGLALANLLDPRLQSRAEVVRPKANLGAIETPHYPIKARRIIHLCMAGGPSQFETFDWKPELKQLDTQPFP